MNQLDVFAMFALVAYLIGDFLAVISVVGSALVLFIGIVSFVWKKHIKFEGQELQWSLMGLIVGTGLQICLLIRPQKTNSEGFIFQMAMQTVNLLLGLSFCLLILCLLIRR